LRNIHQGTNHNINNFGDRSRENSEDRPRENQTETMILPLLAEMSGSIHVGLAAMGAGIGVGLTGLGAAAAVGRNPGAATPILVQAILAIAFTEAIVFYALYLLPH
jgi:F-type H+-transporting ATPase subunit c